jgi:prophage tail gpP-like protein
VFDGRQEIVTLKIDGIKWTGWKSVEITRQIDAVCDSFSLGLIDRWQEGMEAVPLAAGMPCELLIGDVPFVNGYIDKVTFNLGPTNHEITVSGRSKTADLVDCAAIHSPGLWNNLTALELAAILAEPFGVKVTSSIDVGKPFDSFKLEEGETAFEALDRISKERSLLFISDNDGDLKVVKLAEKTSSTDIIQGENVKTSSSSYDMANRFSDYIVKGQKPGNDQEYGLACAQVRGEARDESVLRYRPFMVRAENQVSVNDAIIRAKWEASTRAARAVSVTCALQGWRDGDDLWAVNTLVYCKLPYLRIDGKLLISKVTFTLSQTEGVVTKLELKDQNAFQPEPPKKKAATGTGKTGTVDLQQEAADQAWSASKEKANG